ncbi:LysR family transcriptional regulator [Treponema brennaborense]|uniref:Transcriptional regulator, LysR family n=1 Tax=Treponema brennaborense (strain DSM 12168 / CIP 105900 / DD5/3) TaxID=906968 RepID=F4LLV6_TREBD|nr:LysR family transcriptional regulator [Treponema brennaborense]AEE15648.1 transcriptional regulator, LysR family [Treponema brennaborense DSM 12168]
MELRHLTFFLAVANEGNITRAAEAVHTSQPNLSRQLQELEESLGCKLLNRGKVITLTEAGELLKRRAEEILRLTAKTEEELSESPAEMAGTVAIGFGEMKPVQDIARLAVSFKAHYPNVRFDFFTGTADQVKEQMEKGLLDAGMLLEPVEIEKYDFFRLEKKVQFVAVMQSSAPLAEKKSVTPQDLAPLPLIFPVRRNVRNELFSWFGEYAQKLNLAATGNLAANTAILVQNGLGTAIGSDGIPVPLGMENQITCRPLEPELSFSAVIAWKKSVRLSPLAGAFIRFAKSELKPN